MVSEKPPFGALFGVVTEYWMKPEHHFTKWRYYVWVVIRTWWVKELAMQTRKAGFDPPNPQAGLGGLFL